MTMKTTQRAKYAVEDYNNADNAKIYADATKYLKVIDDWGWITEDLWGSSLVEQTV